MRRVSLDHERDPCPAGALLQLRGDGVELRPDGHRAERDDARARLELAEEQHLVDQLADLLDLGPGAVDEVRHVLAGEHRRLEQRQQPRERGPQLVRDGRREPGAQLLVGGQVTAAREVDEPLPAPVHVVGNDERDDPGLARQEAVRELLALRQTLDRLARAAAGREHAIVLVEHERPTRGSPRAAPSPARRRRPCSRRSNRRLTHGLHGPQARFIRRAVNGAVNRRKEWR